MTEAPRVERDIWNFVIDSLNLSPPFPTERKPRPETTSRWQPRVSSGSNRPPTRRHTLASSRWRIALSRKRSDYSRTALPPAEREASGGVF